MTSAAAIGSRAGIVLAGIWQHNYGFAATMRRACVLLGLFLLSLAPALPMGFMLAELLAAGIVAGYINVDVLSRRKRAWIGRCSGGS